MNRFKFWIGFMEVIAFLLLLALIVFFARAYSELPNTVSFVSNVSNLYFVENKTVFFVVVWLGFASYGALFILKRFPRMIPFPVKINAENIDIQINLARFTLSLLTVFTSALFLCGMYYIYLKAIDRRAPFDLTIVLVLFIMIVLSIIVYIILARMKNKVIDQEKNTIDKR
jgi:cytochrome c biogenesis factor